jgi:hypothetical protein
MYVLLMMTWTEEDVEQIESMANFALLPLTAAGVWQ